MACVGGRNPYATKTLALWSAADIEIMKAIFQAKKADGAAFCDERGFYDIGGLWLNPDFHNDLTRWDTYDDREVPRKTLIVHGREDETVPIATAHRYYRKFWENAPKGDNRRRIICITDMTGRRLFEETPRFLVAVIVSCGCEGSS